MYVDDKFIHWLKRNSTQTIAKPLSFRGTFHIWTVFYTFWVTSSQKVANELDHTVNLSPRASNPDPRGFNHVFSKPLCQSFAFFKLCTVRCRWSGTILYNPITRLFLDRFLSFLHESYRAWKMRLKPSKSKSVDSFRSYDTSNIRGQN